ncbi:MAG: chlorite dismutase family protein [Elusimicrobia bacterium]|nr:chlorite dismutase family protein [Elusimicrobiota bacterium]
MEHAHAAAPHSKPAEKEVLDIAEKGGTRQGVRQSMDRRLFMQLSVFTGCKDARPLAAELEKAGLSAVLYADVNDPSGVGVLACDEDPALFAGRLREVLTGPNFDKLSFRPEMTMLGRTYALGYEPDLEDWLLKRPQRVVCDPQNPWAIWYPLRRTGAFNKLPHEEQMQILKEHGNIGRAYGDAGLASDIRLASFGLDAKDNDFVIGLIGSKLYPLSSVVQSMRKTRQTSEFIQNMGPFFVGKALWQSRVS